MNEYPVLTEFDAVIRRPAPREDGMTAQFYASNGKDADAINSLGRSEVQDALVQVMASIDGEAVGGFDAYVRRPKPYISGMAAQFFGENGAHADLVAALGLSKFLEKKAHITVRLIKSPEGEDKAKKEPGPYAAQAAILWKSMFFRTEAVWRALGTDEDYIAWVQLQASAHSGEFSEYVNGEGRCVAAHVARIADGHGKAIKAEYACIPLKQNEEHALQHQHGESVLRPKEWWDKQRIRYVQRWAWETLLKVLRHPSMTEVAPADVQRWAKDAGLDGNLPNAYLI